MWDHILKNIFKLRIWINRLHFTSLTSIGVLLMITAGGSKKYLHLVLDATLFKNLKFKWKEVRWKLRSKQGWSFCSLNYLTNRVEICSGEVLIRLNPGCAFHVFIQKPIPLAFMSLLIWQDSHTSNWCSICTMSLMLLVYCECGGTWLLIQCGLGLQDEPGKSKKLWWCWIQDTGVSFIAQ